MEIEREQDPGSRFPLKQLSGLRYSSEQGDTSGRCRQANDRLVWGHLAFGVSVQRAHGVVELVTGKQGRSSEHTSELECEVETHQFRNKNGQGAC